MQAASRKTQQQRSEETRDKLVAATFDLICKHGAASFTTAKVAEAAGLTRGAIQYHFEKPNDLLREVIVKVVHSLSKQIEDADLSNLDKETRLNKLVDLYWEGYRSDTYIVFIELTVRGRLDPEFSQIINEALEILEQERDEQWLNLFADYAQTDAEKLDWRALLLVNLRGLALKQMFSDSTEEVENIYRNVKESYVRDIKIRAGISELS